MKLVITGVDEDGRSFIKASSDMTANASTTLWFGNHIGIDAALERLDPGAAITGIEPPPGEVRWRVAVIPAGETAKVAGHEESFAADGMHYTRTVDYDYVLSGPITCHLNSGAIELQTGDAIVLPAAPHSWTNSGTTEARILCFLTRPSK